MSLLRILFLLPTFHITDCNLFLFSSPPFSCDASLDLNEFNGALFSILTVPRCFTACTQQGRRPEQGLRLPSKQGGGRGRRPRSFPAF